MTYKNRLFLYIIINYFIITLTKGQYLPKQKSSDINFDFFYTFKNTTLYNFEPYTLRSGRYHCNFSGNIYKCAGTPSILTYSDCCSYNNLQCCIVPQDWIIMLIMTLFLGIFVCLFYSIIERITYLTIP
uniref:CX domain-containing protein n=1 Tax=Strongyloides stercoralis TaxID=6248 RepID=A0A0K0DT31_STRER